MRIVVKGDALRKGIKNHFYEDRAGGDLQGMFGVRWMMIRTG
jgi:hypothetical protein